MILCVDYAHYYMGSWFRFTWPDGNFIEDKLIMINNTFMCGYDKDVREESKWYEINDLRKDGHFQLMLRHICDLTQKQKKEYKELCYQMVDLVDKKTILRYSDTPLSMDYLFRNGIDVFDLIEKGDAIDIKL